MKAYVLARDGHKDLFTFIHRDDDDVEILFRLNIHDIGEPIQVNDWFGDSRDQHYRADRPTQQTDGVYMRGEARWIWDALVKHYNFFRA